MTLPAITAAEAKARIEQGAAVLVDVREAQEHARESIPGAKSVPLSRFDGHSFAGTPQIIFHCQGSVRTAQNAERLARCDVSDVYLLEGGLNAWKSAGLPTRIDRTKPIEMQRQVQIAAGSLVLLGLGLSVAVSPWLIGVTAFVGCGLVFAGISGWCGMAKLLALMPWNKASA